jgi:hypothetical protein
MAKETWKSIKDFPIYEISSKGRVKSLSRIVKRGTSYVLIPDKILSLSKSKFGYMRVQLFYGKKKAKFCAVHRLVAIAFVPNPENKPHVNHKSCIKTDNRVENLEWVTPVENQQHALEHGRYRPPLGEESNRSKLKETDIAEIKRLREKEQLTTRELGERFNVSQAQASRIISGKTWRHLKQ